MIRNFPEDGYDSVTGEWNDSLKGNYLWSNVNVNEAAPDVMTPSTWSLLWIFHYEANFFRIPGDHPFCGNIGGRPYLNMSLVLSMYHAIGKDMRRELHADMMGSAPADLDIPIIPFSPLWVILKVLPDLLKARRYTRENPQRIQDLVESTPGWCCDMRRRIWDIGPDGSSDLLSLWQQAIRPNFIRACWSLRSVTLLFADPATKLRLDLQRLVGDEDANAMLSNLAGSDAAMESLGPVVGLDRLVRGEIRPDEYLQRYGHRGPHEMELLAPDVTDDPDWIDRRLQEFSQLPVDVQTLLARQRASYDAAWQRFESRYPRQASSIRRRLDAVSEAARTREAVRSEFTRIVRVVRQYVLRAGELSGLGEDIFFLSLDEIAAALSNRLPPSNRIAALRSAYTRYIALPPYPPVIIGHFDPVRWAADPNRRSDHFDSRQSKMLPPSLTITGFAGSTGCVEGTVRRIDDPAQGSVLQPGEILVASMTNVGWTPLFPRAAAVVTDVGATLSHTAIVARELGIPAVVGCGNATMHLKTGDRVRVDGGRGIVEILSRA